MDLPRTPPTLSQVHLAEVGTCDACLRSGRQRINVVESSMVLCARLGRAGKTLLARFLEEAEIEVVEFTADHWTVAADAFIRYGNGRHPAGLNFGDCMTYAVAKLAGEPLLCLGDDFPATDLELASLAS